MPELAELQKPPLQAEILTSLNDTDLFRLTEILTGAFKSIRAEEPAIYIPKAIEADNAAVIVSRNSARLIAGVLFANVNYGGGKLRGWIDDVATHKDSLRLGHGATILDYSLKWFELKGVKRVGLTSSEDRLAAHALYRSRGFEIHETNKFQKDLY